MYLKDKLDNSIQGKLEVTWDFTWKSLWACGEQGDGATGSRRGPRRILGHIILDPSTENNKDLRTTCAKVDRGVRGCIHRLQKTSCHVLTFEQVIRKPVKEEKLNTPDCHGSPRLSYKVTWWPKNEWQGDHGDTNMAGLIISFQL